MEIRRDRLKPSLWKRVQGHELGRFAMLLDEVLYNGHAGEEIVSGHAFKRYMVPREVTEKLGGEKVDTEETLRELRDLLYRRALEEEAQ